MFDITPWRGLTRTEWMKAHRAARMCRKGQVKHEPVNMLAKYWALSHAV